MKLYFLSLVVLGYNDLREHLLKTIFLPLNVAGSYIIEMSFIQLEEVHQLVKHRGLLEKIRKDSTYVPCFVVKPPDMFLYPYLPAAFLLLQSSGLY